MDDIHISKIYFSTCNVHLENNFELPTQFVGIQSTR